MDTVLIKATLADKARHCNGGLLLPVSDTTNPAQNSNGLVVSPYFQTIDTRKVGTGRNTHLFLANMDILILEMYVVAGVPEIIISLYDSSTGTYSSTQVLPMTWADVKANGLMPTVLATINSYATTNSFTVGTTRWFGAGTPGGLANAPQAAIAAAPADAVTNYNVVTTLLGTLTSAVNTANQKQNDIATKLNTLLSELVTLGIIHA